MEDRLKFGVDLVKAVGQAFTMREGLARHQALRYG